MCVVLNCFVSMGSSFCVCTHSTSDLYLFSPTHATPPPPSRYSPGGTTTHSTASRLCRVLQIFHFCSILILLSALMFQSSESGPLTRFETTEGNTTTVQEKHDASHYFLVVFVISIVVVSSLYFFVALGNELHHSFSHFLKVNRTRKKQRKTQKAQLKKQKEAEKEAADEATLIKGGHVLDQTNPLHSRHSLNRMRRLAGSSTDSLESKSERTNRLVKSRSDSNNSVHIP